MERQRIVPQVVHYKALARQALGKVLYHQRHNVVIRLARGVKHAVLQRREAHEAQHLMPFQLHAAA